MKRFLLAFAICLAALPCFGGTRPLKEDTATVIVVGPFVDSAGAAVTAPTIASIDITAYKNDGTAVNITPAASGSANDMVHVDDGYFSLELTATDVSTVGYLRLSFQISGALIFHEDFNVMDVGAYNREILGYEYTETGGRIWFVDGTTDGTGDTGTKAAPFDSIQAAISACSPGDTIDVANGTYAYNIWTASTAVVAGEYRRATATAGAFTSGDMITSNSSRTTGSGTFDATEAGNWTAASELLLDKDNVTLQGQGPATIITANGSKFNTPANDSCATLTVTGDHCIIRGLNVIGTHSSTGAGIHLADSDFTAIENCTFNAMFDAFQIDDCDYLIYRNNDATAQYDGGRMLELKNGLIQNSSFKTTGDYGTNFSYRGAWLTGTFLAENCTFISNRANNANTPYWQSAVDTNDVNVGVFLGIQHFRKCAFICQAAGTGTASTYGLNVNAGNSAHIIVEDCEFLTSKSGSGTVYDVAMSGTGDTCSLISCNVDDTKLLNSAKIRSGDKIIDDTYTKASYLPSATAGASGGLFIAGSNAATTANITGNITGNVSGSVGSLTGHTPQTGDAYATAVLVLADTDHIDSYMPATGPLLNDSATVAVLDNQGLTMARTILLDKLNITGNVPTAGENADAVAIRAISGSPTAGTAEAAWKDTKTRVELALNAAAPGTPTGVATAADVEAVTIGSLIQPRANKPAGRAYQLEISSGADGTYKATKPVRLRPGEVLGNGIAVDISMKPQFGDIYVQTVGTPVVSGGSLTCAASGPRDQVAQVIIDGTATASENRTITVPVTMETGEVVPVTFDVKVYAD